jgi:hypothetical protein
MRKIFYLLLVFMLVLFACSAGCTSSTAEKEVLTQEEFQAVMDARAATSSPTTVSTPVPTQTPLTPDFKCSVGDVLADEDPGHQQVGWIILDYRSATDEYLTKLIYRNSTEETWKVVPGENATWSDRVSFHESLASWTYHIDQENVKIILSTPTPTATPVPTVTPVPTATYQNGDLWIDISQSRNRVGNLVLALADDADYLDFQSMKSNGEKLEQTAQRDYNTISKYRVSSDYQNLKTKYLSSLDKMKYAGKYCKMAADEYLKGNEDKSTEYLYKAQDYLDSATPDLDAVVKEMGW